MSDASERFLDLATKPLAGNHELRVHARWELGEKLKVGSDDELEEASRRLEISNRSRWNLLGSNLVIVALAISSIGILANEAWSLFEERAAYICIFDWSGGSFGSLPDAFSYAEKSSRSLSPENRLLLLGDTRKSSASDRAKGLWDYEPENAGYFANYSLVYRSEHHSLPPDFATIAEKLDPENAWFPFLEADEAADKAVEELPRGRLETEQRQPRKWKVLDQTKFDEALNGLHRAAKLPKFESYELDLLVRRNALLPQSNDLYHSMMNQIFHAGSSNSWLLVRRLCDLIAAKSQRLGEDKDIEGFRLLLFDWRFLTRNALRENNISMLDSLVLRSTVDRINPNLLQTAKDLDLKEEISRLEEVESRLVAEAKARKIRVNGEENKLSEEHGGMLSDLSSSVAKQVKHPPVISIETLKPSRRIDHAFMARALDCIAGTLLLVGLCGLASYRYRHGELCRRLSMRLAGLFDRKDWGIVLIGGVGMPIAYFVLVRYFSPLGGLDWSLKASLFRLPPAQYLLLTLLIPATSLLLIRKRLARRMNFFQGSQLRQRIEIGLTILGYLALPLFGFATQKAFLPAVTFEGSMILGLLMAWLICLTVRGLFGDANHSLARQTTARLMVPAMVLALVVFPLAIPLHHAEERYWVSDDTIAVPKSALPRLSAYESDIAKQMKAELLEILAPLEEIPH